jgi:hypothetical protein
MTINSLSGGKTSSFLGLHFPADLQVFACVCLDAPTCAPDDPAIARYAMDKLAAYADRYGEFIATAESDKTLRVMMDLEQMIGQEIVWTRGKSFDETLNGRQTRLPSWARRYCTQQMKVEPIAEYVWLNSPDAMNEMRIGYRADELYRMDNMLNTKISIRKSLAEAAVPIPADMVQGTLWTIAPPPARHKRKYEWVEVPAYEYHEFVTHYEVFKKHQKAGFQQPNPLLKNGQYRTEKVRYRTVAFPLIEQNITKADINAFWAGRGIDFPQTSNCVGCFYKPARVINAQFALEPAKMRWFADQEKRGMGTWHDDRRTYDAISRMKFTGRLPLDHELYSTCDTGGCTD